MNKCKGSKRDRWIRDLRWVIASPFLMNSLALGERDPSSFAAIPECSIDEAEAERFAEQYTGHRVGYYFENLIHYWLKHVRQLEILAQGFQVVEQGRTLGEIDFVFRDEQGQVNHWEVAVKFYLHYANHKVMGSHYIGPNAQDTFELKREKIFGKQLLLSEKTFPEVSIRQAFVKGRIFYHPSAENIKPLPQGMMQDHLRAVWIRCSETAWLESTESDVALAYHLIEKPHCLSPECMSLFDSSLLSLQELNKHLAGHFYDSAQPILISVLVKGGDLWQERDRVFVVADDWPNGAGE